MQVSGRASPLLDQCRLAIRKATSRRRLMIVQGTAQPALMFKTLSFN
jgi:hypothetical protein